jgi:hypothetical protein
MSNSPAAAQAAKDNQRFWQGIQRLPEQSQRSFWDAGVLISEQIGENPAPRVLKYDMSSPPKDMPWYERIFFYIGQSHYNQAVTAQAQSQALAEGTGWLWGALQGDFNKSPSTGQVVVGGIISLIPVVDQVCDVRDIVANCLTLNDPKAREDNENWIALGLTCIGFVPEIGSAVKTVGKVALKSAKRLLDLLKHMEWLEKARQSLKIAIPWGRAPIDWLRKFNWQVALKQAGDKAKAAFLAAKSKLEAAAKYMMGLVQAKTKQLVELFDTIAKKIGQVMSDLAQKIKDKIKQWLGKAEKEAGNYDAVPGKTTNKHGQGDREPPPDKRPKPRLTGVQTEKDTAFFWSGKTQGVGGDEIAAKIAKERGGTTLEMLIKERGIKMPEWDTTNPASVKAWKDISADYAKGASGNVRAVVGNKLRPDNIWETRELPALKANPAVKKITVIDPLTMVEKVIFSR